MKASILTLVMIMALAFSGKAQSSSSIDLVKAVQELTKAMIDADESQLKKLTAKELSYGHCSGNLEDQATFISSLVSGKSDFVSIELKKQKYEVIENIGIVRHTLVADTNDNGQKGHVEIGIMMVWTKRNDHWKLLARQAYKL